MVSFQGYKDKWRFQQYGSVLMKQSKISTDRKQIVRYSFCMPSTNVIEVCSIYLLILFEMYKNN